MYTKAAYQERAYGLEYQLKRRATVYVGTRFTDGRKWFHDSAYTLGLLGWHWRKNAGKGRRA